MSNNVIIGVLTRHVPSERRTAVEATWAKRLADLGTRVVFLTGQGDHIALEGNTLCLPCLDDYMSLAFKTRLFAKWALTQEFDYVFKCDDDTFIVFRRFAAFRPNGDYTGIDPVDDVHPRFASGGAGYFLSRRAVEVVAEMDICELCLRVGMPPCAEDFLVYRALTDVGISFTNDVRFQAWNEPHRYPTAENNNITLHYVKPDLMRTLDARCSLFAN